MNAEKSKVNSSLEDMSPLEDASNSGELAIEVHMFDEGIVIEMPKPYEYTDNKAVP